MSHSSSQKTFRCCRCIDTQSRGRLYNNSDDDDDVDEAPRPYNPLYTLSLSFASSFPPEKINKTKIGKDHPDIDFFVGIFSTFIVWLFFLGGNFYDLFRWPVLSGFGLYRSHRLFIHRHGLYSHGRQSRKQVSPLHLVHER